MYFKSFKVRLASLYFGGAPPDISEDSMFRPSLVAALSLFTLATLPLAAEQQAGSAATTARRTVSKTTVAKAKEQALTTSQGNALTSTSGHMSDAVVRLRDARFGRIVDTQLTDKSG